MGTILNAESYDFSINTKTGELSREAIRRKAFPWKDDPSILEKISMNLSAKIGELEADIATCQRDQAGFISTLQVLPSKKQESVIDKDT